VEKITGKSEINQNDTATYRMSAPRWQRVGSAVEPPPGMAAVPAGV